MGKVKDMSGERHGNLTVMEKSHSDRYGWLWHCCCDCGNESIIRGTRLRDGTTKSCGCLLKNVGERTKTHGQSKTKEYQAWINLRRRCNDPSQANYPRYGGRGITVCERWESFESFLTDVGQAPTKDHSIGRIDNDGNYTADNCRWETTTEQANNRRNNRVIQFRGENKTTKEWADIMGLSSWTLYKRLDSGWSIERALTEPTRPLSLNV